MAEGFTQANLNLSNEDLRKVEQMMAEDAYEIRSAWFRHLIRREYATRKFSRPNPDVTVAEALAAGEGAE